MRSAGCIVNDILDRKFDKRVFRTKDRPIASGKISVKLALLYASILCLFASMVLINFNFFTIIIALASMPFSFTYPLMKRFTYWPQLFLGITFNYGLILGWTSIENNINIIPIVLYFGAIFWTLGYDTVYGYQDIADDEIIGVKSTSIKFKNNPKKFLFICYSILILTYLFLGQIMNFNYLFYIGALFITAHLFFYQLKNFNHKNTNQCFEIFKSNNFLGLIILVSLYLGRLSI